MIDMNQKEQAAKIEESNEKHTFYFCPIANSKCVGNCVCFETARFVTHNDIEKMYEAYCSHVLINGYLNVES